MHSNLKQTARWHAAPWIGCGQYFAAEAITAHATRTAYSPRRNVISDLGVVGCNAALCSPLHAWMNASLMLQGLLIASGALLLSSSFPRSAWSRAAVMLLFVSGVALVLVGAAPEDVRPVLHYAAATIYFLAGDTGMVCLGAALLLRTTSRVAGTLSCLAGAFTLLATITLGTHTLSVLGSGTIERAASYPFTIWLICMGTSGFTSTFRSRLPKGSDTPVSD